MKVRPATQDDLHEIVRMGLAFFDAAGYDDITEPDTPSMLETADRMMQDQRAVLLIAEHDEQIVGMAGVVAYPFFFNKAHLATQEIFWWVDDAHRKSVAGLALLDGIESWARSIGARSGTMIALDALEGERVGKLYRHRGYRPSERTFIRRFEYGH